MLKRRDILAFAGVGILAATAGAVFGPRLVQTLRASDIDALRTARLVDLSGKPRSIAEWDGSVLVCNFWATWCEPCREEIPAFVRVRNKIHRSGVEFVGIAIDNAANVAEFAGKYEISYPLLLAGASGIDLIRKLGNPGGGLPFTLLLDRKGNVAHRKLGALSGRQIAALLAPLLNV